MGKEKAEEEVKEKEEQLDEGSPEEEVVPGTVPRDNTRDSADVIDPNADPATQAK